MRRIPPSGLREELESAVFQAVEQIGLSGLNKAQVIRPYLDRGVARSTLFAWVDAFLATGKPAARVAQIVEAAVDARSSRSAAPAADAAHDIAAVLPKLVGPHDIMAPKGGTDLVSHIRQCIEISEQLIKHAKTEEGGVRNAKLLGSAGESLRRCMETAIKLQAAIRDIQQVDALHASVIEEVAKESPECAERIHMRILKMTSEFRFM